MRGREKSRCVHQHTYTHVSHKPHPTFLSIHACSMGSRESSRPPSRGVYYHKLSRQMLTAPLPSLDSFFAVVTSTPPIPSFSFSANGFNSFSHSQRVDPSTGLYTSDPLLSDPPGSCGVKEDVWFGAQSTSPSSPFTYVSSSRFDTRITC